MVLPNIKRKIKDSVFTFLFKQPEYTLQLYQTLHPEDTDVSEEDCKVVTLENIMLNDIYNDLGFMVKNLLIILVEAQSTFTLNVVLRLLLYVAASLKNYVQENNIDLYGNKAAVIPRIELYVVYTGTRKNVPNEVRLSDLFAGKGHSDIDVTVHILRRKSKESIVDQYIRFCEISDEQRKIHGYTETAIRETIRICLEEGILVPFLRKCENEVNDIMTLLFDAEYLSKAHDHSVREEGRAEGREEGRAEGWAEGIKTERARTIDILMQKLNLSYEEAKATIDDAI